MRHQNDNNVLYFMIINILIDMHRLLKKESKMGINLSWCTFMY